MKAKSILQEMADEDVLNAFNTIRRYCGQQKDCKECVLNENCLKRNNCIDSEIKENTFLWLNMEDI